MKAGPVVLKKDLPAGRIERTRTGGRFVYDEAWKGRAIADRLPVRPEPYETPNVPSLPTYFVNLLPEGTVLHGLSRRAKVAEGDLVGLLALLAEDAVGDVTVRGMDRSRLRLQAGVPFYEAYRRLFEDSTLPFPIDAISGAQPKMSVDRLTLPYGVEAGPGAFLKLSIDDRFPRAVENEAFFMAMAADCGLPTAKVQKIEDRTGTNALLVHRFDRIGDHPFQRLHQEDTLQLLDLYPLDKYSVSVEEIGAAIRRVVASWPQAGSALILQFAFGYLIGNHDQHAKNVSVLETPGDGLGLSPVYDMLCTLVYGDQAPALTLNGQDEDLSRADFLALAQGFGIQEAPVLRRLDAMLLKARPWLDRLGEIGFDSLLTERLRGALVERHAALTG